MSALLPLYLNQFLVFVLVLTRVSGLIVLAPVWGSSAIPIRIRAFLAVGLSLIITPLFWHTPIENTDNLVHLAVLMGCEFVTGLAIGLAVMIYFAGLQLAGQVMGQMSGMSLADVASPTFDATVPVFSQFLHFLMLAVFVVTGGHRYLLETMLDIFQRMPPGHTHFRLAVVDALAQIMNDSFALGLQLAAPIMVALLLSILLMGLISRTLPQLNVLAVGFSVNGLIMLSALLLSLGVLTQVFTYHHQKAIDTIRPVFDVPASAN
jgi:flagellar biosynthetic protein FliR